MIYRHYQDLNSHLNPKKINIIYGPRQVGKTTLIQQHLKSLTKSRYLNKTGDELDLHEIFSKLSIGSFHGLVSDLDLLVIDEAQLLPNIGRGLKILHDQFKHLQIIVSGSASFDLVNKVGEPLTGRDHMLFLYPISQLELVHQTPQYNLQKQLNQFLIFGSYPEVINAKTQPQKIEYLQKLVNSYLLKDVLALEQVKGSKVILDLLRLIAFQIGKEVSQTELGSQLGLDSKTVARYLDLLEKAFVLVNVRGFSRNLRKEIAKSSRYYFIDNGIRNALINNFNLPNLRNDLGMLWENFIVSERLKKQQYRSIHTNNYFWRTYDQKEVDWVEERNGKLFGYEFKWKNKPIKAPKDWLDTYDNASYKVIHQDNYLKFIT